MHYSFNKVILQKNWIPSFTRLCPTCIKELHDAERELSQLSGFSEALEENPGTPTGVKEEMEAVSPGTLLAQAGMEAIASTNPASQKWQLWSKATLQSFGVSHTIDLDSDSDVHVGSDVPKMILATSCTTMFFWVDMGIVA